MSELPKPILTISMHRDTLNKPRTTKTTTITTAIRELCVCAHMFVILLVWDASTTSTFCTDERKQLDCCCDELHGIYTRTQRD